MITAPKPLLLLVDDSPSNLHVLAAILRDDYRLRTATEGRVALQMLAEGERPEVILLDLMMPGMSGQEVLHRLRQMPGVADIPVVLVTADASEAAEVMLLEEGADDYLTKPVVPAVLKARVRTQLRRRAAEQKLRLADEVLRNTGEGIVITSADKVILDVNPAYCRMMGYDRDELIGKTPHDFSSGRHDHDFYRSMWQSLREHGQWVGEIWDRRKDGSEFPKWLVINAVYDERGAITHFIGIFSDISVLKTAEAKLQELAFHDSLTGLPNRLLFRDRVEQEIAISHRNHQRAAVLFLDLDRFKNVNDTLGHDAGDLLLKLVSERLHGSVRSNDTVARQGGDEFMVLLRDIQSTEDAALVAGHVIKQLQAPFMLGAQEVHIGTSIGIALYPEDGRDFDALTKHADVAMYHAKASGGEQFSFFSETMNVRARERLLLETELHHALERNELVLAYQPQADIDTGCLTGAEALLRWRHPERGLVSPNDFIPLAEETGLILPIGEWVIGEACRQIRAWINDGLPLIPVAVNLSARQFHQPDLVQRIEAALNLYQLPTRALVLEITETTVMDKAESTITILNRLADAGFSIAIDDFGTGYSSLSYLKRFPVDKLKVDKSFVSELPGNANDAAIATAIIQMGTSLGLRVVAEGVETSGQRDFLVDRGSHGMQGYWYGRPMLVNDFTAFVQGHVDEGTIRVMEHRSDD
jgi:diguanylate cyclase (GGDEF)-like protein/PAS domain S-box-containing protein